MSQTNTPNLNSQQTNLIAVARRNTFLYCLITLDNLSIRCLLPYFITSINTDNNCCFTGSSTLNNQNLQPRSHNHIFTITKYNKITTINPISILYCDVPKLYICFIYNNSNENHKCLIWGTAITNLNNTVHWWTTNYSWSALIRTKPWTNQNNTRPYTTPHPWQSMSDRILVHIYTNTLNWR